MMLWTQIVLSIPTEEMSFVSMLAKEMGWKIETKESLLDRFIQSCPKDADISDEDIQNEVNAVRKG